MSTFLDKKPKVCEGCSNINLKFVPGDGNEAAEIFILGEAPAENEIIEGRPFCGKAGDILNSLLRSVDLRREDVYVTNAMKCSNGDRNIKPTTEILNQCAYYWKKELLRVRPKVLLAAGNKALKAITGKEGISTKRGGISWYELEDREGGMFRCKMIPIYHPAYLLYSKEGVLPLLLADMQTAVEELKKEGIPEAAYAEFEVLDDVDAAVGYLESLCQVKRFSFDFETTGLVYWKDHPVMLSLSHDGQRGYVLPFLDEEGDSVWSQKELKVIKIKMKKAFESPRVTKIGHNEKFDIHWLVYHFGISTKTWRYVDTSEAYHLLDENIPLSLDVLSELYTEFGGYKAIFDPWKHKVLKCPRQDILYPYGATDAVATYQLYVRAVSKLKKEGLWELYKSEIETLRYLFWAEEKGMLIDLEKFDEVGSTLSSLLLEIKEKIYLILRHRNFNPASPEQVSKLLFRDLNLRSRKNTKGGNKLSTDNEVLKTLVDKHPIVPLIINYREISKLFSTYIKGFRQHVAPDGAVHTEFRADGTLTGRVVARRPNLLNIPNEGKAASIRSLFIAAPGYVLISADASQVELRVLAHLSGDKAMLKCFAEGRDLHTETASAVFEIPFEQVTPEQRRVSKTLNFAISYGSEGASLEKLGFSREQITLFMHNYFKRFKGLYRYIRGIPAEAMRMGYIKTPFGRKRRVRVLSGELTGNQRRSLINFPAQSTAADEIRIGLNKICRELKHRNSRAFPVVLVYDEIVIQSPIEEVEEVKALMKKSLERPIQELNGTVFPVEIGIGRSWKEAQANAKS